jgi:hypothetical protein
MAIRCSKCKKSYPDDKKKCPHCGAPAPREEEAEEAVVLADDADEDSSAVQVVAADQDEDEALVVLADDADEDSSAVEVQEASSDEDEPAPPAKGAKATKLAPGDKPKTMLAGPGEEGAAGPAEKPGKATRLAGTRPATMLGQGEAEDLPTLSDAPAGGGAGRAADADATQQLSPEESDQLRGRAAEGADLGERPRGPGDSDVNLGERWTGELGAALGPDEGSLASDEVKPPAGSEPSSDVMAKAFLEGDSKVPVGGPDDSSAVDLGSAPALDLPSGASSGKVAKGESGRHSDIDLGAMADESETGGSGSGVKIDDEPAAAETEEGVEAEEEAAEEPAKKRGSAGAFVGGGVLGLLIGAGACAGLWYAGYWLPGEWRGDKPEATKPPGVTQERPPAPELPPLQAARDKFERGNFEEGLKALEKVPENSDQKPEEKGELLAERGAARWLAYRQKHAEVKPTDQDVQKAKEELAAANNPEGLFWLGQIQEGTGDLAKARESYQQGLRLADAKHKRRFQAALDRLDSRLDERPEANPGEAKPKADKKAEDNPGKEARTRPAVEAFPLGLALLPAQLPTPKAGDQPAAAAEPEEAGFDFWQALKMAKDNKYDEALQALQKARKAHEQRRFLRRNRAQNPDSDPNEEIFLRTCDELQNYLQVRKALNDANALADDAGRPDAAKAVAKLLNDKKAADAVVTAVVERLKKDKDVAAADPDLKDIGKGIDLLVDAKKKTADQVAAVRTALENAKYLTAEQKDALAGLNKLIKDQKDEAATLAATADLLKPGKFVDDKDASVPKGVEKLLAAKKAADQQAEEVTGKLKTADGTLQNVAEKLAAAKYLPAPRTERAALLKGMDHALADAASPVVKAVGRVAGDVNGVAADLAGRLARGFDLTSRLALTQEEVARYQVLLMQARTPREMLDLWLPLLQDRGRKDLAEQAVRDAQHIAKDKKADPEVRAEARAVEGVALRNLGKYAEARKALQEALAPTRPLPAAPREGDWRSYAHPVLTQLTNPTFYYLAQAEKARAAGKPGEALAILNEGLEVFPKDTKEGGRLLAVRSLVHLDLALTPARPQKPVTTSPRVIEGEKPVAARPAADAAQLAEAAKDAAAAIAAGAAAEGHYAAGRLAEAQGNWAQAEKDYRQALDAHPAADAAGSRYRVALARVLLKEYEGRPAPQEKAPVAPPAEEKRPPAATEKEKVGGRPALCPDVLMKAVVTPVLTPALEEAGEPKTPKELQEIEDLADQAIKGGDPEGHLIKARVLARKGLWTEALREYLDGLERLCHPPERVQGMRYLVENHPVFRMPEGLQPPNPILAERHYARGLHLFWAKRFPEAEAEFFEAARYNDEDARYVFYLGLARLGEGKRDDAYEAFKRGGQLEGQSKPNSSTVSVSLERVQGPVRKTLNRFRP